jgi:hypothetical protein
LPTLSLHVTEIQIGSAKITLRASASDDVQQTGFGKDVSGSDYFVQEFLE